MSNPSAGGSKASIAPKTPSGSTDPGQVDIKLPVLRILSNGFYEFIKIKSTTDGISLATGDLHLGHVPDVRVYLHSKSSWEQRLCIRAVIDRQSYDGELAELRSSVPGIYYVMICELEELGLHDTARVGGATVGVCGDAFIFKVLENGRGVNGRAVFEPVPVEIISDGVARSMLQHIATGWEGGEVPRDFFNLY